MDAFRFAGRDTADCALERGLERREDHPRLKAAKRVTLPEVDRKEIAAAVKCSIREMEQELAEMKLRLKSIDEHAAKIHDGEELPMQVRRIIAVVSRKYNVSLADIRSIYRHADITRAREMVTVLAHDGTRMSFPEIARALGRKSHSSFVIAYWRFVARFDERDKKELRELVKELDRGRQVWENGRHEDYENLVGKLAERKHQGRSVLQDKPTR